MSASLNQNLDGLMTVGIASGQGVSEWVPCRGEIFAAVTMPAELNTAGQITFEHAWDAAGLTGGPLIVWPDTLQLVIPFTARATILLPASFWSTLGWLRLVAGTSESPAIQAADRLFTFGRRAR